MKTLGTCRYCGDPVYDFQELIHHVCGEAKTEAETRIIVKEIEAIYDETDNLGDLQRQLKDYIIGLKIKMEVKA